MPSRPTAGKPQPRVTMHTLPGAKKALEVCALVERLYGEGRRVAVWCADAARAEVLDQYLWTFSQSSFVPHEAWRDGAAAEAPVLLVVGSLAGLPAEFDTVVVADRAAEPSDFARFREIHDLVAKSAEDEGKRECWEGAGFEVRDARAAPRRSR